MFQLLAQVDIGDIFKSPFGQPKTIGDFVGLILNSAFVLAGIFVLILFLVGGFSLIQGAGNGNPEAAEKGKKAITSAVTGFIIIFAAYWIIRIIEKISGSPFVTKPIF